MTKSNPSSVSKSSQDRSKPKDTLSARIIGNWGDPGVSESGLYDFLSRFLIVEVIRDEDSNARIACEKDWQGVIMVVLRPPPLWIFAAEDRNHRVDFTGITNKQINLATDWDVGATYESQAIQPITPAYKMGDLITIKKLEFPFHKKLPNGKPGEFYADNCFYNNINCDIFQTLDNRVAPTPCVAPSSVGTGLSSKSYKISAGFTAAQSLALCVSVQSAAEAQMRYEGDQVYLDTLKKILGVTVASASNSGPPATAVQTAQAARYAKLAAASKGALDAHKLITKQGGVMVAHNIAYVAYVDTNYSSRMRLDAGCIPNVIVSPSSFPTAVRRNLGAILVSITTTSGTTGTGGSAGTSGSSGTTGTAGSAGSGGTAGTSGTTGTAGTAGSGGTSGARGYFGSTGLKGNNGSSGISGTSGNTGTSGVDGTHGTAGSGGSSGTGGTSGIGSAGTSGTAGSGGSSGTAGSGGSSGTSGTAGSGGSSGTDGATGATGP